MASDLGFFLQAFNPVDYIKGYEESEKFATEQDLRKAQTRQAAAQAGTAEVTAEEFASPQFRQTRGTKDLQQQYEADLGKQLAKISGEATTAEAGTIQEGLQAQARAARQRALGGEAEATFQTREAQPFRREERRALMGQDEQLRQQRLNEREQRFRVAEAQTAEQIFGIEGRRLLQQVEQNIAQAKQQDPNATDYDVIETMKAGADPRTLVILNMRQKEAGARELIRASVEPASPQFQRALQRFDPNLRSLGVDPDTGGVRIGRVTGTDEKGNETIVAAGIMGLRPDQVNDFIIRMSGQLPQARTPAPPRATAAAKTVESPRAEGAAAAGVTAPTPGPTVAQPAATAKPAAPPRSTEQVVGGYAVELNNLGAAVPAGADVPTVLRASEETRARLDKVHTDLRKELFGKPGRNMESQDSLTLRQEMSAVEEQMRRLRTISNTLEDTLAAQQAKSQATKARSVQELLQQSAGNTRAAAGKITQPVYGP